MAGDDDTHSGPLAEFAALREEINRAWDLSWKVVALQLTSVGAIFGFSLSSNARAPLLLIVPFSSYVLCARWVLFSYTAYRAADYIRTVLSVKVPGGLQWEWWAARHRQRYGIERLRSLNPNLLLFFGSPCLALLVVAMWFSFAKPADYSSLGVSLGGILLWLLGVVLAALTFTLAWPIASGKARRTLAVYADNSREALPDE
ncbi:hypothetical protein [Herbihabitans rhizosphaerae]|uniref:hypothetical protein n=1 Tax=Herbihabitans rhizosphaerae TaxID=1872711 RepID=UPI00102B2595|nr:hypothetical protein [Herbihabitans rhizosphaerae]